MDKRNKIIFILSVQLHAQAKIPNIFKENKRLLFVNRLIYNQTGIEFLQLFCSSKELHGYNQGNLDKSNFFSVYIKYMYKSTSTPQYEMHITGLKSFTFIQNLLMMI